MKVTCTCGHTLEAATYVDAWLLFDRHVDQAHGRRFPAGDYARITPNPARRNRKPPLTHQGGES